MQEWTICLSSGFAGPLICQIYTELNLVVVNLLCLPRPCRAPLLAFKTENAGDAAASSGAKPPRARAAHATKNKDTAQTKALSSGSYVYYQDASAPNVGLQALAPNAARFTSVLDCLVACDLDNSCAGIVVDFTVEVSALPKTCRLIKGDARQGIYKRSMARADISRLQPPVSLTP